MASLFGISVSGLQAATNRLSVSAQNVVNLRTGAAVEKEGEIPKGVYQPLRVEQKSLALGGVESVVTPAHPKPVAMFELDPSSPTGISAFPVVDLGREMVEQRIAAASYRAIASVIRTKDEMDEVLLDLKA